MKQGRALAGSVALALTVAVSWVVVPTAGAGSEGMPEVLKLLKEVLARQAAILEVIQVPDLIPNPYFHHVAPPGPADFCRIQESGKLWVSVYNQGPGGAGASVTQVLFRVPAGLESSPSCGTGCFQVDVPTPGLVSHGSAVLEVTVPEGCFGSSFGVDDTNNCQFKIIVDGTNVVPESSEVNNAAFGACQGLV